MTTDLPLMPANAGVLETLKLARAQMSGDLDETCVRCVPMKGALHYLEIAIASLESRAGDDDD